MHHVEGPNCSAKDQQPGLLLEDWPWHTANLQGTESGWSGWLSMVGWRFPESYSRHQAATCYHAARVSGTDDADGGGGLWCASCFMLCTLWIRTVLCKNDEVHYIPR